MTTPALLATPPLDAKRLLNALQPWVKRLQDDLRARAETGGETGETLRAEYDAEFAAGRTGEAYGAWLEGTLTQAAVAWVLAGVFVRFLEDNHFIAPRFSGPGARREEALEMETAHYRAHPTASATDYMLATFAELQSHRATALLFDPAHVPLWRLRISGDAAGALLGFWRAQDPDTGALAFSFASPTLDTRFLGDMYQDLSEFARKKFALLQTPEFVEAWILDRTLEPALERFGLPAVRLIDPTCGSGHFLLGAFERLFARWQRQEPGTNPTVLVGRALAAVHGVDLNPYAAAIARFRLIVAGLQAAGVQRLANEVDWQVFVAVGDTLLCAPEQQNTLLDQAAARTVARLPGLTRHEDAALLTHIFQQRYHAVVGNPPYITVKDKVLNEAYRKRFPNSCHRQYSLGVPFTEVFFRLAVPGETGPGAGFVGMITADSFMKREFGKKLIETVLPRFNLTHVVSTSGAYIPGHGTPTVILYGTNAAPESRTVRVVMGIQGEPSTPADPAQGLVWQAIVQQIDQPGSASAFISVADVERATLAQHPWSIGGGGAAELKEELDTVACAVLTDSIEVIGFGAVTREDDAFIIGADTVRRFQLEGQIYFVSGEEVRDFSVNDPKKAIFPYDAPSGQALKPQEITRIIQFLWPFRTGLSSRVAYGKTQIERGLNWYEYSMLFAARFQTPLTITFAEVATHNHFVLDRGGKVFKQTAPVIKLPASASEDDHLGLLGLLNSSTACFWLQQVCHNKGGPGGGSSKDEKWHDFYAFNGTKVAQFPLVEPYPLELARRLDTLGQQATANLPATVLHAEPPTRARLDAARAHYEAIRRDMIALQEELDWNCYRLYGLTQERLATDTPVALNTGERAFEIALARAVEKGEAETKWFSWLNIAPQTELPSHWPPAYAELVSRRLDAIANNPSVALIERTNYKRRWESEPWEKLEREALRSWILDRLESPAFWAGEPHVRSTRELAEKAAQDAELVQAVELFTGQTGADMHASLAPLVAAEAAPFLPAQRYTDAGLRKRTIWEDTWALQRREDAGEDVGRIPAPPKYKSDDFRSPGVWRLRGPLDVPKERFISYPALERLPDDALLVGWAGWNHLEQARALAAFYDWATTSQGWDSARLTPLLAGIAELLPWLQQWHHQRDPATGTRPSEDFAAFLAEELRLRGLTPADLAAWAPPAAAKQRRKKGT